jgi:hypothetical protein
LLPSAALDLALGQPVRRIEHRLRIFGHRGIAVGQRFRGAGRSLRRLKQRKKAAFVLGQRLELRGLRPVERKLHQLLRRLAEILPQSRVIVDQLRIVEDQLLADQALERRRLFVELAAGAARLRRLQHRLLTLRPQAVETDDQFDQCIE